MDSTDRDRQGKRDGETSHELISLPKICDNSCSFGKLYYTNPDQSCCCSGTCKRAVIPKNN